MTAVGLEFAPSQANAIAQQMSHDPKTVTAHYELPQRANKAVQTLSLLEIVLRHRLIELEEDNRVQSSSQSGMPQPAARTLDDITSNFVARSSQILLPFPCQALHKLSRLNPCHAHQILGQKRS